jgi:hypothetical protein
MWIIESFVKRLGIGGGISPFKGDFVISCCSAL